MTETTAQMPGPTGPATAPLFVRPQEGRILAGVCAGIAQRWGLDVTLVRIATVVLTLLSGIGLAAYVAAWLLTPSRDAPAPLAADSELAGRIAGRGQSLARRLPKLLLVVLVAAVLLSLVHTLWLGIPVGLVVLAAILVVLFGTRLGRWAVGIVALLVALAVTAVAVGGPHAGTHAITVTTADDLRSSYDYGAGKVQLDLSAVNVTGRHTTHVRLGRGDVTVTVPRDVAVLVHAHTGVGSVTIDGHEERGFDTEQTRQIGPGSATDDNRLRVDIEVGAGSITVR
jgi:phage shock protein PspC (stress-responsive transcriptional regulator)